MQSIYVQTKNAKVHALTHGNGSEVVVLIHGNASNSMYWRCVMEALPENYKSIAPDMRGYGKTEPVPLNAELGYQQRVEDFLDMLIQLGVEKFHIVGHSLGGAVCYEMMNAVSDRLLSVTLVNPASPYGFGGTKNKVGDLCWDDFAGTGGGLVNPLFVEQIKNKVTEAADANSPRSVMNAFYWKPPFEPKNIDELVDGLLEMQTGDQFYPADFVESKNFPFVAPGKWGAINAASPKGKKEVVAKMLSLETKPAVLWVRGSDDQIVSDMSFFEAGTLGKLGFLPNYPGEEVYPPQPMVAQTRYVLEQYQAKGGIFTEFVMANTGHSPYIENPDEFNARFIAFLQKHAE